MHAVAPSYQEFLNQNTNMDLLGEIITWDLSYHTRIPYSNLLAALEAAELETKVARKLLPRFAFARAAKKMEQDRLIRFVGQDETGNTLAFQFTKEYKDYQANKVNYDYEANLFLNKETGAISVASDVLTPEQRQELANTAAQLLAQAIEDRTTADVTRVIKRLFEKKADLFPVREAGSVYFVPATHSEFVDRVQRFVTGLAGRLNRFPVPAGTQHGNQSVKEAVTEGLQKMIADHEQAVATFGTDTRESTINKALDRIEQTRFKIESYKDYLEGEAARLDETLGIVRAQMNQKMSEVLLAKAEAVNA